MDEVAKLLVGECVEIGKGFHALRKYGKRRPILQPWLEG
jgi:hypothetical protein